MSNQERVTVKDNSMTEENNVLPGLIFVALF